MLVCSARFGSISGSRSIIRFRSTFKDGQLSSLQIDGTKYTTDSWTNVTPSILRRVERKLHLQPKHPINLLKQRVVEYFTKNFLNRRGNPVFSIYDRLSPVVTLEQNFDSLLVPANHPSRAKTDSYYVNEKFMLRAHTSAHQRDLIMSGLDAFLAIGDVYRRDEIDRTHYPVFHQGEGVRLFSKKQLFKDHTDDLSFFEATTTASKVDIDNKQLCHSIETAKLLEHELKSTLEGMINSIFQENLEIRWVDACFPFTHPSFEMEVKLNDVWIEVLGCGVIHQEILKKAGVQDKVGWAFGLGLERIAMLYYGIEDIRAFWSTDAGFHAQFDFVDPYKRIKFKPISTHPSCSADLAFWIPSEFEPNDFYDVVRSIGGDIVQEVAQVDVFKHPKTSRTSHCYRITYRHIERTLSQAEVNDVHESIAQAAQGSLSVELRRQPLQK